MHSRFLSNQQRRHEENIAQDGDSLLVLANLCLLSDTKNEVLPEKNYRFRQDDNERRRNQKQRMEANRAFLERYNREQEILVLAGEDPDKATGKLELQIARMMDLQAKGVVFSPQPAIKYGKKYGLYRL